MMLQISRQSRMLSLRNASASTSSFPSLLHFHRQRSPAHVRSTIGINRRAILLTPRELEPYHLYDRTAKEFNIERYAVSLEDMAKVTEQVYYAEARAQKQT